MIGVGKDKLLHFIAGIIIFEFISAILYLVPIKFYISCIISFIITEIIGYVKELYDKHHIEHSYEIKDFIATSVGNIVGFILLLVYMI